MTPSTLAGIFDELAGVLDGVHQVQELGSSAPSATATPGRPVGFSARKTAVTKAKKRKKKRKEPKPTPVCTASDLKKRPSKRRKCVTPPKTKPTATPSTPRVAAPVVGPSLSPAASSASSPPASPTGPVAAPPAANPSPEAFPTPHPTAPVDGLRTYTGAFGVPEAQRLLFRAGFGPKPGQAEAVAALGLEAAVEQLMSPGPARMEGPAPKGDFLVGGALAPQDRWGHLHLDMLDRQIRSTDSLTERMTLVLHDWFAVNEILVPGGYFPSHIDLLRKSWRGSFRQLLLDVTQDKSMLLFLNGVKNRKDAPNENYARELMELYALGADRGAYTETDVREAARALTGFYLDWRDQQIKYDDAGHDAGTKRLFAGTANERTGNLTWQDAVNAIVDHELHGSFVARKLWSYFIPTEPSPVTEQQLVALYRQSGERLEPLVKAILLHPDLHAGARMVKPPTVLTAGLLRSIGRGIDTQSWIIKLTEAGQMMGQPPNVSGWNDRAWLSTSTHNARWRLVSEALRPSVVKGSAYSGITETPEQAVEKALRSLGSPQLTDDHLRGLNRVARSPWSLSGAQKDFLAQRQNVLRQLIGLAPDFQVS